MKRNITVIVKFATGEVCVTAMEKVAFSMFPIFYQKKIFCENNDTGIVSFIRSSVSEINNKIGGNITTLQVLVANTPEFTQKNLFVSSRIHLPSGAVKKSDFFRLKQTLENHAFVQPEYTVASTKIARYKLTHLTKKSYLNLPIDRSGTILEADAVVNTLPTSKHKKICKIIENAGYKTNFFLTSAQVVPHETISEQDLKEAVGTIHIGRNNTYLGLCSFNTLIHSWVLPYGTCKIIQKVALKLNKSFEKAQQLFFGSGTLDLLAASNKGYLESGILCVVNKILRKIFEEFNNKVKELTTQKISVVISGSCIHLKNLQYFGKNSLYARQVVVYHPLSYLGKNNQNLEFVGMLKYIHKQNQNMGKKTGVKINTTPNTLRFVRQQRIVNPFRLINNILSKGVRNAWW